MYFSYVYAFEWFCLLCSLATLLPSANKSYRWLFWVSMATVVAESAAYLQKSVFHLSNHYVYNLSVPGIILLLSAAFYKSLHNQHYQYRLRILIYAFVVFVPVNALFIQGWQHFATYYYIVGAIVVSMAAIMYLLELIQKPVPTSLITQPLFWTAAAVLIMYIPKSCLYAFFEYLSYVDKVDKAFAFTFQITNLVLSIIFYTLLSIGSTCKLLFNPSKTPF